MGLAQGEVDGEPAALAARVAGRAGAGDGQLTRETASARAADLYSNALLLMGARIVQLVAQAVTVAVLLRRLDLASFGKLSILLSMAGLVRQFGELGQDLTLSRAHLAADASPAELLGATLVCRTLAVVALLPVFALATWWLVPDQLACFALLYLDAQVWLWAGALNASARAREEPRPDSLGALTSGLVLITTSVCGAHSPLSFAVCSLASSATLLLTALAHPWQPRAPRVTRPARETLAAVMADSRWLVGCAMLGYAYARVGLATLYLAAGPAVAGAFSAAQRLLQVALLIPNSVCLAFFPRLSQLGVTRPEAFSQLAQRVFTMMLTLAVPCGLSFALLAPDVIELLVRGDRTEPAQAVVPLAACLAISFAGHVLGYLMLSGRDLFSYARFWMAALPLHIALAALAAHVHPHAGAMAGAFAVSDAVVTSWLYVIVGRDRTRLDPWPGLARGAAWGALVILAHLLTAAAPRALRWTAFLAVGALMGLWLMAIRPRPEPAPPPGAS